MVKCIMSGVLSIHYVLGKAVAQWISALFFGLRGH